MAFLTRFFFLIFFLQSIHSVQASNAYSEEGNYRRFVRSSQNFCYHMLADTYWDYIMGDFKPGRVTAMNDLDIKPSDRVLFVGEWLQWSQWFKP